MNIPAETVHESSGVVSALDVSDFHANPINSSCVDNFRSTKAEDILYALKKKIKFLYKLLYKRIDEKKYSKATEQSSIIEVLATVVLRCFNKDATAELYLANLLVFDSPEVDRWDPRPVPTKETFPNCYNKHSRSDWYSLFAFRKLNNRMDNQKTKS